MIKNNQLKNILSEVSNYYSDKITKHGTTPLGVDWNNSDGQEIRFKQLTKIISSSDSFTINDLGCGYGALYHYLKEQYNEFHYTGIDISKDMINAAVNCIKTTQRATYIVGSEPSEICDYGIASGIFNVRLERSDAEWLSYFETTLDILNQTSRCGFSFNCLTSYSDTDKMRDYLYYADPCKIFDLCKKKYSRDVSLLHDYGLYEFTILVRKD